MTKPLTAIAALLTSLTASMVAYAQDSSEREAIRLQSLMFPSSMSASEQDRTKAQLMSYWMLPLKERQQLWTAASKGEHRSGASIAQAAGLAAGLSAGNPLSATGITRGGTALAAVSLLSILTPPRGAEGVPVFSRVYVPGKTREGIELSKYDAARSEAIAITTKAIKDAAQRIERTARCIDGCETEVQVWALDGIASAIQPLSLVWRRGEMFVSLPDHPRNASMPFFPRFESRGLNGWVIELTDVAFDVQGNVVRIERDNAQLPQPTESWARTGDGIRFLQSLTASGHIVQGRLAERYVAALGRVYDTGELTATGFLATELRP